MEAHSVFFLTEAGVCPLTSSMSPSTLKSCFSCASPSGYYCTNVGCSDSNVERLFVQSDWYPGTATSLILDTVSLFTFLLLKFQYKFYFIVITTLIKHYSLLGYRSQQRLHLYNVFSRRFLVTILNNTNSPTSVFTSSLFEFQIANSHSGCHEGDSLSLSLSLILRPTVRRPVCLGIKNP
jgi:hypothetical protein